MLLFSGVQQSCAQTNYEFNLKDQPYLEVASKVDCNEMTTTIENLVCTNLRLQKVDSLLNQEYEALVTWLKNNNKQTTVNKVQLAQDSWKKYRFLHCENLVEDGGYASQFEAIAFMECGIDLTEKRRTEIMDVRENIILEDE